MQIKSAIEEIIKNPLKVLNLYDNEGIPAKDIYKSIKRRSGGVNNG